MRAARSRPLSRRAFLAIALAIVAGCFESGSRWEPVPDAGTPPACTLHDRACAGSVLERCDDSTAGPRWTDVDDCGTRGEVCAPTLLRCAACIPNAPFCDGSDSVACNADGSRGAVLQTCDASAGDACRAGICTNLCAAATKERSNVGCEYWAVDLDNANVSDTNNAAAQQFAVVVSNAQPDVPATVTILQDDGQPGDAPAPFPVATSVVAALNLAVFNLGPREVDGSADGTFDTGTGTALTRHAYKVVSNVPVVAYQFNPLDNVNVFSNDASLLKPREALAYPTTDLVPAYVVAGWPQTIAATDDPDTNFNPDDPINLRAFLTIVGTTPGTKVRITTTAAVVAGGPVAATPAGGVIEGTVDAFDVLNLETGSFNADFTGSVVEANGPVAVFSGSEASDAPHFATLADRRCCADHLEDQLDPLRAAGKRFAIAHTPSRTAAVKAAGGDIGVVQAPDFIRFVCASKNGARIHTSLAAPDDEIELGYLGDFREVVAYADFVAESTAPIHVAQIMASQEAAGIIRGMPGGDPSLLIEPPVEQFRPDYVFLTPDKYAFDFVSIVAPPSATVVLDGQRVDASLCPKTPTDGLDAATRGSPEPPFVTYTCQLGFPTVLPHVDAPYNVLPGVQHDGVHRLVASEPVGVVVSGFDSYVSYSYAAGTELKDIAPPQ